MKVAIGVLLAVHLQENFSRSIPLHGQCAVQRRHGVRRGCALRHRCHHGGLRLRQFPCFVAHCPSRLQRQGMSHFQDLKRQLCTVFDKLYSKHLNILSL